MFIKEFYATFISEKESNPLFDALRRVSRLETGALLSSCPEEGWPEWPSGSERGWPEWPAMPFERPEPEKA
jgi:hypothetical protein